MREIKLRKVWRFGRDKNKTHLYNFSTTKHYAFDDPLGEIFYIFQEIKTGINRDNLFTKYNNKFPDHDKKFISKFIKILKKIDVLENEKKTDKTNLFSEYLIGLDRQIEFFREIFPTKNPWLVQKKIKDTNVAILGLGTIAQHIIPSLIASGIGNYTCVDFDLVERRNLGRQFLFRRRDIGKLKTNVISSYIKEAKSGIKVKTVNEELKNEKQIKRIIKNCDLVIHCCDTPRFIIHQMITNACASLKKPNLVATPGKLGPLVIPKVTACYGCLEKHMEKKFPGYNQIKEFIKQDKDIRFPGLAIVVSITGVLAAKEILSYILKLQPETINGMLRISPQDLKIQRIPIPKQIDCPLCGKNK